VGTEAGHFGPRKLFYLFALAPMLSHSSPSLLPVAESAKDVVLWRRSRTCPTRSCTFPFLIFTQSSYARSVPAEAAKEVVLAQKPVISDTQDVLDPALLQQLLSELGTLASVYHKPPAAFVSRARLAVQRAEDLAAGAAARLEEEGGAGAFWRAVSLWEGCFPVGIWLEQRN
jgi:hypothetical protein